MAPRQARLRHRAACAFGRPVDVRGSRGYCSRDDEKDPFLLLALRAPDGATSVLSGLDVGVPVGEALPVKGVIIANTSEGVEPCEGVYSRYRSELPYFSIGEAGEDLAYVGDADFPADWG